MIKATSTTKMNVRNTINQVTEMKHKLYIKTFLDKTSKYFQFYFAKVMKTTEKKTAENYNVVSSMPSLFKQYLFN